jgi:hypothetical protein
MAFLYFKHHSNIAAKNRTNVKILDHEKAGVSQKENTRLWIIGCNEELPKQ